MRLKSDVKFEEKLICCFRNDKKMYELKINRGVICHYNKE